MSAVRAYLPLLRTAGVGRLLLTTTLARLSTAVLDIPLILLVQAQTHSYAIAGVAIALDGIGMAVSGPWRGRALDRLGASRLIPVTACIRGGLLAAVWPLAHVAGAVAVLPMVFVAGASTPSVGSAMRLHWKRLLGDDEVPERVYAFDTVLGVSLFVVGPALAAVGISTIGSGATLVVAAALLVAGAGGFGYLVRGERSAPPPSQSSRTGVIGVAGVRTIVLSTLLADAALGVVDITVPAFAREHGHPSVAGVALALFSVAGTLAGVAYGARSWTTSAPRRVIALTAAGAALDLPLVFVSSLGWLVGLLVLAGLPLAAQWTTSSLAVDRVVGPDRIGEALSWIGSANAIGVAGGETLAGLVVDAADPHVAFAVAVALLASAAALLLVRRRTLTDHRLSPSPGPVALVEEPLHS